MKPALILVDIQNDFMPGGALPVPDGDAVVAVANRLMPMCPIVVATQDWHPPDHGSFASRHPGRRPGDVVELAGLRQILWPDHCVQGTEGAAFHPALRLDPITSVFKKGTDPNIDSYSGFFDNGHRKGTGLADYLKDAGVTKVVLVGLATDYCVKFTALDARTLGFDTVLVVDGCRAVNLSPGDEAAAIDEMKSAGVAAVRSADLAA